MSEHFVLNGHVAVPVDFNTFAKLHNTVDRRVGLTKVGDMEVSTVFLGRNHEFDPSKPPLLFETMIFGDPYDNWCWRAGTWDEAEVIHERTVQDLRDGKEPGEFAVTHAND